LAQFFPAEHGVLQEKLKSIQAKATFKSSVAPN